MEVSTAEKLEQLREKVSEGRMSNSLLARITGKSSSTVSQVLNGKYQGRPEVIDEMLQAVEAHKTAHEDTGAENVSTWLTGGEQLINGILNLTYHTAGFSAIVGPSGIGKTYTSKLFSEAHSDTAYIRCADSMGDVVQAVLDVVGAPAYGTKTQKMRRAIAGLKERGIKMLLVDEADLLVTDGSKPAILRKISVFREIKESGVGVAMIGLESFDNALRSVGETYVTSRLDYFRKVKDTAQEELAYFLGTQGWDPETLDGKYAIQLAPKRGSLRFLTKLSQTAKFLGSLKDALAVTFTTVGHVKEV
ncbi:MAG: ATP-binding protein [Synergistaceae bacterium]|nr:ATP-binding protein [Synergistaceae bacterium]